MKTLELLGCPILQLRVASKSVWMQDLNTLFVGDLNIPIRCIVIEPENIKRFYAVHPASFRIDQIPGFYGVPL